MSRYCHDVTLVFPLQTSRYWDYVIDHCLSRLVIESLVVSLWRALWNMMNDVILPRHFLYSRLATWGAGMMLSVALLGLQKPISAVITAAGKQAHGILMKEISN